MVLRVGSLFSGIGGLDLGLERSGMRVIWQSEVDPYAVRVLERHWPGMPNLGDITEVDWNGVERPDVICGGFPCQDISQAGKGEGLEGSRSSLWWSFHKAISVLRPRYAVVENVPMLDRRGLDRVLSSLSQIGYDAEWNIVSARYVGACHRRARLFILAYTSSDRCKSTNQAQGISDRDKVNVPGSEGGNLAHPHSEEGQSQGHDGAVLRLGDEEGHPLSDTQGIRGRSRPMRGRGVKEHAYPIIRGWEDHGGRDAFNAVRKWWETEPPVGRVVDGVPKRVDRIRCLGNAVVPQVGEYIGRCLLKFDEVRS